MMCMVIVPYTALAAKPDAMRQEDGVSMYCYKRVWYMTGRFRPTSRLGTAENPATASTAVSVGGTFRAPTAAASMSDGDGFEMKPPRSRASLLRQQDENFLLTDYRNLKSRAGNSGRSTNRDIPWAGGRAGGRVLPKKTMMYTVL